MVQACTEGDLNLFMSLSYNNQAVFRKLIQGDLNHPYKSKFGPFMPGDYLYVACSNGNADIASHLLKNGAEENKPYNKVTPVMVACINGYADVSSTGIMMKNNYNVWDIFIYVYGYIGDVMQYIY